MNNFLTLLFLGVVLLILVILYGAINSSIQKQYPPDDFGNVVPFKTSEKPYCAYTRTSCDPTIPSDCANKCLDSNASTFKCVNLNSNQPSGGSNVNGGGYVCLPEEPTNECVIENGGANIWTGYGATNQQGWSCLCTQPLVYGGEGCKYRNPSYCSGGTINPDLSCTCPENTEKRFRTNVNTPFCVSKDPAQGGGYMGLAGNQLDVPNWGNVQFNLVNSDDYADWAARIAFEMNLLYNSKVLDAVKQIIKNGDTNKNGKLTDDMISSICNDPTVKSAMRGSIRARKMCSSDDSAGRYSHNNAFKYATYTYADNTYKSLS